MPGLVTVPRYGAGDVSALRPSGLRFGTPALTSRGFRQDDFCKVAQYIHKGESVGLGLSSSTSLGQGTSPG